MKITTVCPSCSAALALTVSVRVEEVSPVLAASSGVPAPEGRSGPPRPGPFKRAVQEARPQPAPAGYVCSSCGQPPVAVTATCRKGENAGKRYQGLQCHTPSCPSSGGRMLSGTFRWLSQAA